MCLYHVIIALVNQDFEVDYNAGFVKGKNVMLEAINPSKMGPTSMSNI